MTIETAIMILENHQRWRRGEDVEIPSPKVLTTALDVVIEEVKKQQSNKVT